MHLSSEWLKALINKLRTDEGQATVEAAFALPALMLLVLLLIQPGIILYDRIVMMGAASEGCRLLSTSATPTSTQCEDFIKRRLSAVPQVEIFHKHDAGCSWDVTMEGNEASSEVKVTITNRVRPLPLLDIGMSTLGILTDSGDLEVKVEATSATQPEWVWNSVGACEPSGWVEL